MMPFSILHFSRTWAVEKWRVETELKTAEFPVSRVSTA
jgi:hypothetical protein